MSDSLSHAKDALGRDQPGEALVHLWSALDAARADENPRDLASLERMAETIAAKGDESERTEAERLLRELDRARGEEEDEQVAAQVDSYEPASLPEGTTIEPDEAEDEGSYQEAGRKKGSPLWGLIGFAVFLFWILRDILR
jgi:hypothetical protein